MGLGGGSPSDEGLEPFAGGGDLKVSIAEAFNDRTCPWLGGEVSEAVIEIDARVGVILSEDVSYP
jgi:hypothetical protein